MLFTPEAWRRWPALAWAWLNRVVFVPDTLVQCVAVLASWAIVWFVAAPMNRALNRGIGRLSPSPLRAVAQALANAASPILLLLLLWFATLAADAAGLRSDLLRLAESLVLVWVLIRQLPPGEERALPA